MKWWFQLFFSVCLLSQVSDLANAQSKELAIIPYPQKVLELPGCFLIDNSTKIIVNNTSEAVSRIISALSEKLNTAGGFNFYKETSKSIKQNSIFFKLNSSASDIPKEGYYLKVSKDNVLVEASSEAGLFYGLQTLLQLLPVKVESKSLESNINWKIPAVEIHDTPKFEWRGLHLDVSRHFMSVDFIKKYIDNMAMHKLNVFHWHLTDDQGWRIEINKYPKLTEVGAWRKETLVGHQYVRPLQFNNIPHGGFYTQEEIKEIVQYASERNITIVPEIDMPGHATAAIAAYPELGVLKDTTLQVATRWGVFPNLYNVNESTFTFLEDVLSEVMDLFPSNYIHIGGDEARKEQWEQSEEIQNKIRELGLSNEKELQSYFIKRIEKFVNSKGRQIIGWDEILEGGLAPKAIVMSWRGEEGGIHAAKMGHKVIMTPGTHLYFDFHQTTPAEHLGIGGYTSLSKVYSYNPIPLEFRESKEAVYIMGAQANVWTEYITNEKMVEQMVFPRIAALSEVLWTSADNKNWNRFSKSISELLKRYELRNIDFSKSVYKVTIFPYYDTTGRSVKVALSNELGLGPIKYTLDGTEISATSQIYKTPISIKDDVAIKAKVDTELQPMGGQSYQEVKHHLAYGKKVYYSLPYDTTAFTTNDWTLVDGFLGNEFTMYSNIWQRFKSDIDITIDLKEKKKLKRIKSSFIQIPGYAYALPSLFEIQVSSDGKSFKNVLFETESSSSPSNASIVHYTINLNQAIKGRYIRFIARNPKYKSNEYTGKQVPAVLMVDEVIVE